MRLSESKYPSGSENRSTSCQNSASENRAGRPPARAGAACSTGLVPTDMTDTMSAAANAPTRILIRMSEGWQESRRRASCAGPSFRVHRAQTRPEHADTGIRQGAADAPAIDARTNEGARLVE